MLTALKNGIFTLRKDTVACGLSRVAVTLTVESDVGVEFSKCKTEQMKFYSVSIVLGWQQRSQRYTVYLKTPAGNSRTARPDTTGGK